MSVLYSCQTQVSFVTEQTTLQTLHILHQKAMSKSRLWVNAISNDSDHHSAHRTPTKCLYTDTCWCVSLLLCGVLGSCLGCRLASHVRQKSVDISTWCNPYSSGSDVSSNGCPRWLTRVQKQMNIRHFRILLCTVSNQLMTDHLQIQPNDNWSSLISDQLKTDHLPYPKNWWLIISNIQPTDD